MHPTHPLVKSHRLNLENTISISSACAKGGYQQYPHQDECHHVDEYFCHTYYPSFD
jgi:hypothetical protein